MRTAGHSAVGAKYLAKNDSEVIAILGCGLEGRSHLRLLNELYKIKEVRVCDIITPVRDKFCTEMRAMLNFNIRPFDTVEETVRGADVICEVTTSPTPTIIAEWIEPGSYVAAPNIKGIGPDLIKKANKWVIGNWDRDLRWIEGPEAHSKEYSKDDIYASLDEIAAGKMPGRESDEEITVMTHHGMGALDTSCMNLVYNMATKKGIGTRLKVF